MTWPLGASTFIWTSPFGDGDLSLLGRIAAMGFKVVEVCVEDPTILSATRVAREAANCGLTVSVCGAFGPGRDAASADAHIRKDTEEYLKTLVRFAAEVGSPHVAGPMYAQTGLIGPGAGDQRSRWAQAVEFLHCVADYADVFGVSLAIEPLVRYEADLVNTVRQGLAMCTAVDASNVGLMLDTYHMNIEEHTFTQAIAEAGRRCLAVQVCENDRGAPGSGHIDWAEVFSSLRRIDYRGSLVIESFVPSVHQLATAVCMWRPVAESPDELASSGFAFLTSLMGDAS